MTDELEIVADPVTFLTPKERRTYLRYVAADGTPISATVARELFPLYRSGKTCSQIQSLHPQFSMGQLLLARVQHRWDEEVAYYREEATARSNEKLQLTVMEQFELLRDILGATFTMSRQKLDDFQRTGNLEHLKDVPLPRSWKDYERMIKVLLMITGQTVEKKEHRHIHEHTEAPKPPTRPLDPKAAAALLEELENDS